MSPIVDLTPPKGGRRSSKYPFTAKEVEDAIKRLDKGESAGVVYPTIKEARGAAQTLKRLVIDSSTNFENEDLKTTAWEEDGKGFAILRVK